MQNIDEIKEQICDVCHKMWQLGWVAANDGNVSARLDDDRIIATPTGISKSFITPEKPVSYTHLFLSEGLYRLKRFALSEKSKDLRLSDFGTQAEKQPFPVTVHSQI